jgi:hypothetical protein
MRHCEPIRGQPLLNKTKKSSDYFVFERKESKIKNMEKRRAGK